MHHSTAEILENHPGLDTETVFEKTELGRQIVSQQVVDALQAKSQQPLGKLLPWKHREEVAEHDGQDGRDLWCVIGDLIYDITGASVPPFLMQTNLTDSTDFECRSNMEKNALVGLATGKKTAAAALDGLDVPELLGSLAPYKCGCLRQSAGLPPGERPFTLRELGRHIYPEVGMYCAVDGAVLDLGREFRCPHILCQEHVG
jgi:predicted heme/steroid binding protein